MRGHLSTPSESLVCPRITDAALVADARQGSHAAFAVLMDRYRKRLFRRVYAITRNREDAEDALQETFLRAYSSLGQFEGRAVFYSWLTRIAINSALMLLRKRARRLELPLELFVDAEGEVIEIEVRDERPNPEQLHAFHQETQRALASIRKLPHSLRCVAELRIVSECPTEAVAECLGTTPTAVKARLHRARRRLAEAHSLSV